MSSTEQLLRTPLYDEHLSLKARMVPFGGWEMPVQYDGILSEHRHTRQAATVFDISHMGEFVIEGDLVQSGLDRIVTMNLADLDVGSSRYGLMLNDNGGTIDDLIIFRLGPSKWFLVVNGATTSKDARHIRKNLCAEGKFADVSMRTGKLDVQGPLSRDILKKIVPTIGTLEYFRFGHFNLLGERAMISRTGYTGELGYEIFYPWEKTKELWKKLLEDERLKPAGLGARDLLRIEAGYSLYGHELAEDITPLEAGLTRFIDFEKDFIGKQALLARKEKGVGRKLIGLICESRRSPRQGHLIFSGKEERIGEVSSGAFSPQLNKGIGLGFISIDSADRDDKIYFGDTRQKHAAVVSSRMFYKSGSLKA